MEDLINPSTAHFWEALGLIVLVIALFVAEGRPAWR